MKPLGKLGLVWGVLLFGTLFLASPLAACPVCSSETGELVRAGIFNRDFGWNAMVTLLPFPILFAVVAWLYLGSPRSDSTA